MDSRIVLDALSPSPATFAAASALTTTPAYDTPSATNGAVPAAPSNLPALRRTLKTCFPPPAPTPCPVDTSRLIHVASLLELQRAILHARAHRRRVRASTGGLSSSSNRRALSAGAVVIDVSALSKATLHASRAVVVAQTAVSLRDLDALVAPRGFSQRVHVPLSPRVRSVGAALGVGGVGLEGLFGDAVVEVSFVDAFGRLRVCSVKDGGVLFEAVKLSLGMFGVVYDVTIQVEAGRRAAWVCNRFVPLAGFVRRSVPRAVQKLVDKGVGVELTWLPFNSYRQGESWVPEDDLLWVRTLESVAGKTKQPSVQPYDDDDDDVAFRFLTIPQWLSLNSVALAEHGYGSYKPEHCKLFHGLAFRETAWKLDARPFAQSMAHAVQYVHNGDTFPVVDVSVCLPLRHGKDEDWTIVQAAWRIVVAKVREYDARGEYPVNVSMKTGFIKSSDALLAPNYAYAEQGRRNAYSACVKLTSAKHTRGWRKFAAEVMTEWMELPSARCDLSKTLAGGVVSAEKMEANFGASLTRFKAERRNFGVDDYGMFLEGPAAELLGGGGDGGDVNDLCGSPMSSAGSWRGYTVCGDEVKREKGSYAHASAIDCSEALLQEWRPGDTRRRPRLASAAVTDMDGTRGASNLKGISCPDYVHEARCKGSDDGDFHGVGRHDDQDWAGSEGGRMYESRMWGAGVVQSRRGVVYRRPLSGSEFSLVYAYVGMYVVLWLALFGRQALQRLGLL